MEPGLLLPARRGRKPARSISCSGAGLTGRYRRQLNAIGLDSSIDPPDCGHGRDAGRTEALEGGNGAIAISPLGTRREAAALPQRSSGEFIDVFFDASSQTAAVVETPHDSGIAVVLLARGVEVENLLYEWRIQLHQLGDCSLPE